MRRKILQAAVLLLALGACPPDEPSPAPDASTAGPDASAAGVDAGGTAGADAASAAADGGATAPDSGTPPGTLAAKHPKDLGIAADPAVIWAEDFEEGTVAAVRARYDDGKNLAGMALVADVPANSGGKASIRWTAGVAHNATDLYKQLPGKDEAYVRWYAKYQRGIHWHHTGVWFGGYNPAQKWPSPQAGLKPNGDDRFSISIEPVFGIDSASPQLDTYDYWMRMHSWMDVPSGSTAYYGNSTINKKAFTLDEEQWICLEVHLKLNTDPTSAKGAVLEVWKNDVLVQRFDETGPKGYWIKDKFCTQAADGTQCTDYPRAFDTVLDLQMRSTTALKINAFWPQNYITEGPDGWVQYDDMIVATERVGCLVP